MERETITIETPLDKHKVVLKAWLTGKEVRDLRNIYLSKMTIGEKGNPKVNPAEVANEVEDKAIETVVISVNGKKENVLETILNMKSKDYSFVRKKVDEITKDTDFLG